MSGLSCELQTATANTTVTSNWGSILLPPSSVSVIRYVAHFPNSTRSYYFRARHPAQPGYSAGPFTPVVVAKSQLQPDVLRIPPVMLTYQGNMEIPAGADLFVSSGKTVKVGTQVTTSFVTKTLRVPYGEFIPRDSAQVWFLDAGWFRPNSAGSTLRIQSPVVLPNGVTVKKIRSRLFRKTTSDVATCGFNRVSDTGFISLATANSVGTSWVTSTGTMTEIVTSTKGYMLGVALKGAAASSNARLEFCEIDYQMPSYIKAY